MNTIRRTALENAYWTFDRKLTALLEKALSGESDVEKISIHRFVASMQDEAKKLYDWFGLGSVFTEYYFQENYEEAITLFESIKRMTDVVDSFSKNVSEIQPIKFEQIKFHLN